MAPHASPVPRCSIDPGGLLACALLSAAVLLAEVALTRLLSVTLYYHYAFAVVALSLAGLGWGAFGWRPAASEAERRSRLLDACSAAATAILLCTLALLGLPWRPYVRLSPAPAAAEVAAGFAGWAQQAARGAGLLQLAVLILVAAVPFFCAGRALAGIFAGARGRAAGMRAAEAAGAALAGVAAAAALGGLGAPSTLLLAALLAAGAGLVGAHGQPESPPAASARRCFVLGGGAAVLALVSAAGVLLPPVPAWGVSRLRFTLSEGAGLCLLGGLALVLELSGALAAPRRARRALLQVIGLVSLLALQASFPLLRVRYVKGGLVEARPLREEWTLDSRVALHSGNVFTDGAGKVNLVWGGGLATISPVIDQLQIQIDSLSATPMVRLRGSLEDLEFLRYDITSLPFHALRPDSEVLVIGAGGGRDLLAGLLFGARRVTGVESNPHIVRWVCEDYAAFTGRLCAHEKVRLARAEARAWLARSPDRFDLIQVSFADTGAAGAAGAYALSENFLYTREALRDYLGRLNDGGFLSLSHHHPQNPSPAFERLFLTALEVLEARGAANAGAHLFLAATPESPDSVATLIVGQQPFTAEALGSLAQNARQLGFTILHPRPGSDGPYAALIPAASRARRIAEHPADIRPSEDDRPFFFLTSRSGASLPTSAGFTGGILPAAQQGGPRPAPGPLAFHDNAAFLLLPVGVLALSAALLPVYRSRRRAGGWPEMPANLYFLLAGFGFVAAELGMSQRLALALGGPGTALTVVLAGLMAASACGAALAQAAPGGGSPPWLRAAGGGAALALAGVAGILPWLSGSGLALAPPLRLVAALGLLVPTGLLMGLVGGGGMRAVDGAEETRRVSAWGASALGAAAAGGVGWWVAVKVGYGALLLLAALAYATTMALAPKLGKGRAAESPGNATIPASLPSQR